VFLVEQTSESLNGLGAELPPVRYKTTLHRDEG